MVEETAHLINQVLNEIDAVLHKVDVRQIDQTTKLIIKNKRIFVLGSGRSGFAAKGFAMRLMHIGYQVYVVGETITPSIQLLSTLFDQSVQIVMDILCLKLSRRDEISDEEAKSKHSNIE